MYRDQLLRLEYYKQQLMAQAISVGQYINDSSLDAALSDFEEEYSIFQHRYIQEGSKLDVKEFNRELMALYQDLVILYRIVYDLTLTEFNKTKDIVDYKLNDLERVANEYYNRTKLETIAIFGETLVYQASQFKIQYQHGKAYISLPSFSTAEGNSLIFLADIDNVVDEDIVLELAPDINVSPYSLNESIYRVPGNPTIETKFFSLDPDTKQTSNFIVPSSVDSDTQYNLFIGHNMVKVNEKYYTLQEYNQLTFNADYEIEFNIYNGTNINFTYDRAPISSNIDNHIVTIKDRNQYFNLKMPANSHVAFTTDGVVFAKADDVIVSDDKLWTTDTYNNVMEYMLESVKYDKPVTYDNPVVVINNPSGRDIHINSLAIKQSQYND